MFELFYKFMVGKANLDELSEEEKLMAECIKNECTDKTGACYELYSSLKKIRNSKNKEKNSGFI